MKKPLGVQSDAKQHDGQLLARLAEGDSDALAMLYDTYAPQLLRFAQRLGNEEDAEDIVQTVFMRVPRLARTFRAESPSARAWLFSIAVHVTQEHRRSLRRLAAIAQALSFAQVGQPRTAPEHGQRRDLERCLRTLSLGKRSVVVLADIEGFSCDEIAAMLDIPVGTVWTRLYYARRKLRTALSAEP